jgi:hypothetical protein
MNANSIILIVVAVLSVFFGYGFGWFEWGRKLKAYQQDKESAALGLKAKNEPPTTPPSVPLPPLPKDEPGLLRLKEENDRLRLDLDGKTIDADLISSDQRKRLIEVVTRLRPWIEGRAAPAHPTPPAPVSAPLTPPVIQAPLPRPVAVPAKKEEAVALSMVAQIDEILQQRIMNTSLEQLGLRLEETPGGGVTVIVGSNRYNGVGEVPDPEVQTALRAAIAAWEKKFTPGI